MTRTVSDRTNKFEAWLSRLNETTLYELAMISFVKSLDLFGEAPIKLAYLEAIAFILHDKASEVDERLFHIMSSDEKYGTTKARLARSLLLLRNAQMCAGSEKKGFFQQAIMILFETQTDHNTERDNPRNLLITFIKDLADSENDRRQLLNKYKEQNALQYK